MERIRLGIVGTNFVSDWLADAALLCKDIRVVGVYSRDCDRGRDFADRHNIPAHYTDYFAMLRDVDAVYIASPTFAHSDQALAAMVRGKDVLCEKMMSASYAQALRMRATAERNGVILLEAMRPDFDPSLDAVRKGLDAIGAIRSVHLEYCQYSSRYDRFKAGELPNAFNPEICNSALADIGIYPLHTAVLLFGSPKGFTASAELLCNGFLGSGEILLDYGTFDCKIVYSKTVGTSTPSVFEGENGRLILDRIHGASRVTLEHPDGSREDIPFEYRPDNMCYELRAFADMIRGRRQSTEYLTATLEAIRIVNEVYRMTGALKYMNLELMK